VIVCNNTWLGVSDRPDKLVLSGEPPERFFPSCFQKDEPGADIFATSYTDKEVCNSCEYTASEDSNNVPLREPGRSFSNVDEKDDPVCRSILHFLAGKLAHKCRRVTGAQERAAGCSGQVTATRTFKKLPDVLMLETRLGVTQEVATSPFRSQIVQGPAGPVHYHLASGLAWEGSHYRAFVPLDDDNAYVFDSMVSVGRWVRTATQEALIKTMRLWLFDKVPASP